MPMRPASALAAACPLLRSRSPAPCRSAATCITPRYLKAAEDAFAFLSAHNRELLNDGKENILDDYCALMAATELYRATHQPEYLAGRGPNAPII